MKYHRGRRKKRERKITRTYECTREKIAGEWEIEKGREESGEMKALFIAEEQY